MDGPLTDIDISAIENRIADAERRLSFELAKGLFPMYEGPREPPLKATWRVRLILLRWKWYAVREWIAVHLLRVEVRSDD